MLRHTRSTTVLWHLGKQLRELPGECRTGAALGVRPRDACDSQDDASHGDALRVTQKARVMPWYIAAMSAIIKWVFYDRGTLRPRFSRKRGFLAAVREGWPFIGVTTRLDNDASAGADRQLLITASKEPIVASTPVARLSGVGQKKESSAL